MLSPDPSSVPSTPGDLASRIQALPPDKRALLEARLQQKAAGGSAPSPEILRIVPDPENRHQPFSLTDIQQAYFLGRTGAFQLGNISTHLYTEIDTVDLDLQWLERSWNQVIRRHDMLRAVFLSDGLQQILKEVPLYRIEVRDLSGEDPESAARKLEEIRRRMSHQVLPVDRWPIFEICATRLDSHRIRLHASFDAITIDMASRLVLLKEWSLFYQDPKLKLPPLELSFRDYVLHQVAMKSSPEARRARDYLFQRVETLPSGPELPLASEGATQAKPAFTRRVGTLDKNAWEELKKRGRAHGLTASSLLLTIYSDALRIWCRKDHFCLNLTLFSPPRIHPQIGSILGDFSSLTLLEIRPIADESFVQRARSLQEQLWRDMDHHQVGGIEVLREIGRRKGGAPGILMPVVFTSGLIHSAGDSPDWGWLGQPVFGSSQTPQVWLDLVVTEASGALRCFWNSVDALFPHGLMEDLFRSFERHLRRLPEDDAVWNEPWSATARTLPPPRALEMQARENQTRGPEGEGLLHQLMERHVHARPDHPAVVSGSGVLSYRELQRISVRFGARLRDLGARPNAIVAIVMEKGWEQVAGALAVLHSGAAFVPIDPSVPEERLRHLLEQTQATLALTQAALESKLHWPAGVRRIIVEPMGASEAEPPSLPPAQMENDLAYVIFTSGSTGIPKGVSISHRSARNTLVDINERFCVGPSDRVLALSSLTFDLSIYDIFGILAAGGTIVLPEPSGTRDPAHWAELLVREKVTIWNTVPALMQVLVEYTQARGDTAWEALRLALLSGDWIPLKLPGMIRDRAPKAQVISLGGATEASVWSILYPIEAVDPTWKSIPYGKPMRNQSFHVLNDWLEPCPTWVPGQLFIGGIGLARGYWRDPEKTDASFITHPRSGERLYRTGDLGRFRADGTIEFLGREDGQVKIQGFRVELGEIEAALSRHPGVRGAVAAAFGESATGRRIVGYILPHQPPGPPVAELREFLGKTLPDYMVPASFVTLNEIPRTANGKVDRRQLPAPSVLQPPQTAAHPPLEGTSQVLRIARLVAEVLKVDRVEPDTDLLSIGATSLDVIRIINRFEREFGVRPRVDDFYRSPTVRWLDQERPTMTPSPLMVGPSEEIPAIPLLQEPAERDAFRRGQPGLRRGDEGRPRILLPSLPADESPWRLRRSVRRFPLKPVPLANLGRLLGTLGQRSWNGAPKYRYASPSGLYPVQVYLYAKPGRVNDLSPGIHYYHPVENRLVTLAPEARIDRTSYDLFVNAPLFDEAAFAIFLIADLRAVAPLYGGKSMHFAAVEAGLISQLLETEAPGVDLGLCQIGHVDFNRIRREFPLDEAHRLIHSLLGGASSDAAKDVPTPPFSAAVDVETRMIERIQELSPGEVQSLLKAHRSRKRTEEGA